MKGEGVPRVAEPADGPARQDPFGQGLLHRGPAAARHKHRACKQHSNDESVNANNPARNLLPFSAAAGGRRRPGHGCVKDLWHRRHGLPGT